MKLGDKLGNIPDNFIEIIKKEPPKLPAPPLPSGEELPPVSRPPSPEKKEEVCTKLHNYKYLEIFVGCLHCNILGC